MHSGLLIKVGFWMVLIGVLALIAPNPAWPEWVARLVLSGGIAVVVTVFVAPLVKRRKPPSDEKG